MEPYPDIQAKDSVQQVWLVIAGSNLGEVCIKSKQDFTGVMHLACKMQTTSLLCYGSQYSSYLVHRWYTDVLEVVT